MYDYVRINRKITTSFLSLMVKLNTGKDSRILLQEAQVWVSAGIFYLPNALITSYFVTM
jgi:hypothetical protein